MQIQLKNNKNQKKNNQSIKKTSKNQNQVTHKDKRKLRSTKPKDWRKN